MSLANPPTRIGPHCWHDDCSMHACDETGYAEIPCQQPGCPVCGAPGLLDAEHWAGDLANYQRMTPQRQERVRAYWERHPMVRRAFDVLPTISDERRHAAAALLEAARVVDGAGR